MHTRLYAGSPLKQDSFERAQALGLEGKTGKTGGTEWAKRAKRHAIFSARSLPVKWNRTERERSVFFNAYCMFASVCAKFCPSPMSLVATVGPAMADKLGAMNDICDSTYDRIFNFFSFNSRPCRKCKVQLNYCIMYKYIC